MRRNVLFGISGVLFLLVLSQIISWVSSGFQGLGGWQSFLAAVLAGAALLWGGWHTLKSDRNLSLPRWLAWLLMGAALLRLAAGIFWVIALPRWGYGTPVEQAGYVMSDAYARDTAAWQLAQTDQPLWQAFAGKRSSDQYGGMLYLSAWVYRYWGGETHQPLLIVVLTAAFSALTVLFAWALARRLWSERAAQIAAWIIALYPEAVLLGSSQMREAFTMTLTAVAFYGLIRYQQERTLPGLAWLIAALLLGLPFSPPFVIVLLGMLMLSALAFGRWQVFRQRWLWVSLAGLAVLAGVGVWLAWGRIAPEGITNPIQLIGWWLKHSVSWQAYFAKTSSTFIRKMFKQTPAWTHLLILTGYGLMQPFLPAALVERGAFLWRGIAIWRALGWTLLLPFLIFALWRAWSREHRRTLASGLSLAAWLGILLPAVRSGGDQWDNPRYRVAFIGLQAALAAWVWSENRQKPDAWLRRAIIGLILLLAWFLPWYLYRYSGFPWPVTDIFKNVGLGIASAILYALWDWVNEKRDSA
jgi:hypothetical protein